MAVGDNGTLYQSNDAGATWASGGPAATGASPQRWTCCCMSHDGTTRFVGEGILGTTYKPPGALIYMSMDSGSTWASATGTAAPMVTGASPMVQYWYGLACNSDGTMLTGLKGAPGGQVAGSIITSTRSSGKYQMWMERLFVAGDANYRPEGAAVAMSGDGTLQWVFTLGLTLTLTLTLTLILLRIVILTVIVTPTLTTTPSLSVTSPSS